MVMGIAEQLKTQMAEMNKELTDALWKLKQ